MRKFVKKFENSTGEFINGTEHGLGDALFIMVYKKQDGLLEKTNVGISVGVESGDIKLEWNGELTGEVVILG